MTKKKPSIISKVILYAFLFYVIYTPSIQGTFLLDKNITIPIITFLTIIVSAGLIKNKGVKVHKASVIFAILILISNFYSLIMYLFNNEFNLVDSRIVQSNLVLCYLVIIALTMRIAKMSGFSKEQLFECLVNLAVVQGVMSILMLAFPSLHNIALAFYSGENTFVRESRIYGISSDYTFATPIYHGIIATMLLRNLVTNNSKHRIKDVAKIALILMAILLNGRTGLVVFIIGSVVVLLCQLINRKNVLKVFGIVIILAAMLIGAINVLRVVSPSTYRFISSFASDTKTLLLDQEANGNYEMLNNSFSVPNGVNLLFGEGVRIYGGNQTISGYKISDIGYVNDLYMGGIVYAALLYGSYIYLIVKSIRALDMKLVLISTLAMANYKGEAFRASIIAFVIIYLCLLEANYEQK